MKILIEINTDTPAFRADLTGELARVLVILTVDARDTGGHPINAGLMRGWDKTRQLRDSDGRLCGTVSTEGPR